MKNMQLTHRNSSLDEIKGCAAVLVVFGHCIQGYFSDCYTEVYIFNFIYAFHMYLFMIISGYITGFLQISNNWAKRRMIRLMIPYFSWIVLRYFIQWNVREHSIKGIVRGTIDVIFNPASGGLWFIYVLCINSLILWLCKKISSSNTSLTILIITSIVLQCIDWREYAFGIKYIIQYLPYFLGGFLLNVGNLKQRWFDIIYRIGGGGSKGRVTTALSIAAYAYLVTFLQYAKQPTYSAILHQYMPTFVATFIVNFSVLFFYPIYGCICCCIFVLYLPKCIKKILKFLGLYTMEIYILHYQLLFKLIGMKFSDIPMLEIPLKTVLVLFLCILLTKLIRNMGFLDMVLLGHVSKREGN